MHGLGADRLGLRAIVKELDLPEELPLRFIFPNAPCAGHDQTATPCGRGTHRDGGHRAAADEAGIRQSQPQSRRFSRGRSRAASRAPHRGRGFRRRGHRPHTGCAHRSRWRASCVSTYCRSGVARPRVVGCERNRRPISCPRTQDPVVPLALAESSRATLASRGLARSGHLPMPTRFRGEVAEIFAPGSRPATRARSCLPNDRRLRAAQPGVRWCRSDDVPCRPCAGAQCLRIDLVDLVRDRRSCLT